MKKVMIYFSLVLTISLVVDGCRYMQMLQARAGQAAAHQRLEQFLDAVSAEVNKKAREQ